MNFLIMNSAQFDNALPIWSKLIMIIVVETKCFELQMLNSFKTANIIQYQAA